MIKKSESKIMEKWYSYDNPIVSICCVTYNHGDYIEEAIDSFLMQETNFPFEIIIHDDASTDNTVDKIKAYAEKYPHIIKTILQVENQYSQGKKIFPFLLDKSEGKYLALCEGDDYWIDTEKLQIQIDLMEENPNCHLSFHAAEIREGHSEKGIVVSQQSNENLIFSTSDVICGGGAFCPTASMVYHRETAIVHQNFFENIQTGDYFVQILGSLNGGALYINRVMSVYRKGIEASWSSSMLDIEKRKAFYHNIIDALDRLDIYTDNKYNKEITEMKSKHHYGMAMEYFGNNMDKQFQETIECSYNLYKINLISYLIFYHLRHFPSLLKFLKKIYKFRPTRGL